MSILPLDILGTRSAIDFITRLVNNLELSVGMVILLQTLNAEGQRIFPSFSASLVGNCRKFVHICEYESFN